nr:THAP domain-containing protein 2-like [Misgurnus anguillicaudatus]XP_055045252.1 THAP domain-containing protein 2-like [Misgurnus anguillicaudatus]XP_055045253.1 THAP domain-containing protein 2-like [Misgurnus anguillicaudatus]XP_055045254.1 THAP domain-containing protein 2-like [Misgurnus anguillicaudatus]
MAHGNCSVVGCKVLSTSLHRVPAAEDRRAAWIEFIYDGNVPATVGKKMLVCTSHFEPGCFSNLGQYNAGLAKKLHLNEDAIPTLRGIPAYEGHARDIGCQTEPAERWSVGTQLSSRTLLHYKSRAVQATVSCKVIGTSTDPFIAPLPSLSSTHIKKEEEEEDPLEGSSIIVSHDPANSASTLTETTVMSDAASTSTQEIRKYIVYDSCLMELFECGKNQKAWDIFISRSALQPL